MDTTLKKIRYSKFITQNGHCFYCNAPMWNESVEIFAEYHSISLKNAKKLKCTAEHLLAKCDGGKNTYENIVAACCHCNGLRHKRLVPLDHSKYKSLVQKRISSKKWHSQQIIASIFKE